MLFKCACTGSISAVSTSPAMDGITLLIVMIAIIFIILQRYLRSRSLPPGPIDWPIFGNIWNIALTCYRYEVQLDEVFSWWVTRYGKVFSFRLGSKLVVVCNDVASAKEAFMSEHIADRPVMLFEKAAGGKGVLFANGSIWRDQRKFSLSVLRRLGIGKSSFEKQISTEVQHVTMEFKAKESQPFFPLEIFNMATCNVISSVVLGKRFNYSDPEFKGVIHRMDRNFQIMGRGAVLLMFPILQYAPFLSRLVDEYSTNIKKNIGFIAAIVETHKADFEEENPTDFVDACLQEIAYRKANGSSVEAFAENNLLATIYNLFVAGSETTATSLTWFLLYMIAYPDVQVKIQQEIDSVIERDALPQLSDKLDLPYTVAATLEVMRLRTVGPLALPHTASTDTYVQGHRIPKDAIVFSNIAYMLHDLEVWDEPDAFKPERFLGKEGRLNKKSANIFPFGIGRRVCLGENIAKMELFLFITHLMHQFTFEKPKDSPPLNFKASGGLTYKPLPFQLIAISRDLI